MTIGPDIEAAALKPHEKICQAYLGALADLGLKAEQLPGAKIYRLSGHTEALIYLKVRSTGKAFFGLRRDFLHCLLGEPSHAISAPEREYLVWLLSDDNSAAPEVPEGWNRRQASMFRRLALFSRSGQPWACVLLLGRDDEWICDGWVLTAPNVRVGMQRWSFSQGEYKVNENHLDPARRKRGLSSVVEATAEVLNSVAADTLGSKESFLNKIMP